jgi:hypothetical protein
MPFIETYVIVLILVSAVLILIYSATLIRLRLGSKPPFITLFVVLLLVANISLLV